MNSDVRLRIAAALPEKLLSRATAEGAALRRVRKLRDRALIVDCDIDSARILIKLCRRFAIDCRVQRIGGWTRFCRRARARRTLPLGVLLCAVICGWFLNRVWIVDVQLTGNRGAASGTGELRALLRESCIAPGQRRAGIDTALLERQLAARAENYSYIGVRLEGVRLLVEASPEIPAPEVYEIAHARDLVAMRDGVVVSVTVRSGEACVRPGDIVRAGQTLIRGEEDKTREETVPVGASGTVVARGWVEGRAQDASKGRQAQRTGREHRQTSLHFLGRSVMLSAGDRPADFAAFDEETEILPIVGLYLPVEITRCTRYETRFVEQTTDPDALRARLTELARADACMKLGPADASVAEITAAWDKIEDRDGRMCAAATLEYQSNIAVTRDEWIEGGATAWKTTVK